jgi:hypothetical protein
MHHHLKFVNELYRLLLIPCRQFFRSELGFSIHQYFFVIHIAYIHCQHSFPFVFEFGFKMSCFDGFAITLNGIFFQTKSLALCNIR